MDYSTFKLNFEKQLMTHLLLKMRKGHISNTQVKRIAQEFVAVLKAEATLEGFMDGISRKAQDYSDIREAFLTCMGEYEKVTVKNDLDRIRKSLQMGGVQ